MPNFRPILPSLFLGVLLLLIFSCQQAPSNLSLPPLFSDHLVLQQNTNTAIWGNATPNTNISIQGSWGDEQQAITNDAGKWKTTLKTTSRRRTL